MIWDSPHTDVWNLLSGDPFINYLSEIDESVTFISFFSQRSFSLFSFLDPKIIITFSDIFETGWEPLPYALMLLKLKWLFKINLLPNYYLQLRYRKVCDNT